MGARREAQAGPAHRTEIRVRVADTDLMGVVYNSNYLVWFEIGRTELIRSRGISYAEIERGGLSLPVTEARFVVRAPARYDDLLVVETRVGDVRRRQVTFLYRIYRDAQLLVEGETTHVPVDHRSERGVAVPGWLAERLAPPRRDPEEPIPPGSAGDLKPVAM